MTLRSVCAHVLALCAAGALALMARAQHGAEAAKAALAALEVPAGLKAELFAADPLLFNPVAFTVDERGRFFIAESHRWKDSVFDLWTKDERWKLADFSFTNVAQREAFLREEFAANLALLTKDSEIIRLVEDEDGDGVAEKTAVFAEGFNKVTSGPAAGVLAQDGELWFACIPDLWKFRYDQQGRALAREVLHTGYGVRTSVSGHDLHGLVRGFDGRIYFTVGDRGANVRTREGNQLESFNSGAVFRCEPDGSHLELFATGLRNPQDLAFDELGNVWTHDNDTSGEDPPRVLEIVEGGEYGWLQAYQFMPNFGPWVREKVWEGKVDGTLPPAGVGAQGPSGLAAYPGVGLPAKYHRALLACDFPQGVWAYFLNPRGASYELRKEKFLWGLGPTDVDFGPDGAVYVSDWGRSYAQPNAGRLLRVRSAEPQPGTAELKSLLSGEAQRASPDELKALLSHSDMRVRTGAQFELERRKEWQVISSVALSSGNLLARIHAVWALGNARRRVEFDSSGALMQLLRDRDAEMRAQAARQVSEVESSVDVARALIPLLKDSSPRARMFAALALGKASEPRAAISSALLDFAGEASTQEDPFLRHGVVFALANQGDMTTLRQAGASANPGVRRAAVLAFRRLRSPELAKFLADPDLAVRRDAARAINDLAVSEAFEPLAERLSSGETDAQILLRAINANFRLGGSDHWERVLQFATEEGRPDLLRADALIAIADWAKPSPLDRVIGVWRPLADGRSEGNPGRVASAIPALLEEKSTNLVNAALDVAEKLGLRSIAGFLAERAEDAGAPEFVRVRGLNLLGKFGAPELGRAVRSALNSESAAMRAEGVRWIGKVSPQTAVPLIERVLGQERDLRIQQSAVNALGTLEGEDAGALLSNLLAGVESKAVPPALRLDILEAAAGRENGALAERARQALNPLATTNIALFDWALAGGNASAGKTVFHERDALGCLRCHAIKGQGGSVGPDLTGIASKRQREHLLESIIRPNAQLTPGYESVSLTLKNGDSIAGTVKAEAENDLTLDAGEDGQLQILKADIRERARTLSAMPEGLGQLMTPRELRDLIEYLGTLK